MSNEPREINLVMTEPLPDCGVAAVRITASPSVVVVGTGGTVENVGQVIELLRSVADQLEAEACG